MTKSEEIDALDKFIHKLPVDSYLWPWLIGVQHEVVADIRNDFPIAPSLAETRKQCEALLAEAKAEAERILARARTEADAECDKARKYRAALVDSMLSQFDRARAALRGYA